MARPKNCGRCNKTKNQCNCGRPTVITEQVLLKLEQAFTYDMTDQEACLYAGISVAPFYAYQKANPKFKERKEQLKNSVALKAKANIARSINEGDKADTKWWLERRRKDEFSPRSEYTGKDGGDIQHKVTVEFAGSKNKDTE